MIPFSKYRDVDTMKAFELIKEIENPNSKYNSFVYYGAIGALLLLNKWIIATNTDEYINDRLKKTIEPEIHNYFGLFSELKKSKFKKVSPSMLEAISEDDFILFFSLLNISGKNVESDIIALLDSLKG